MCKITICVNSYNHIFFVPHIVFSIICIKTIPAEDEALTPPGIFTSISETPQQPKSSSQLACHLFPQMLLGCVPPLWMEPFKVPPWYTFTGYGSILQPLFSYIFGFVWILFTYVILFRFQGIMVVMCVLWHVL